MTSTASTSTPHAPAKANALELTKILIKSQRGNQFPPSWPKPALFFVTHHVFGARANILRITSIMLVADATTDLSPHFLVFLHCCATTHVCLLAHLPDIQLTATHSSRIYPGA